MIVHNTSSDTGSIEVSVLPATEKESSTKTDPKRRVELLTEMVHSLVGSITEEQHQELDVEELSPLVHARLGMASSLFVALRCKHAETAAHCYRVAVTASSWAAHMGLPEEDRSALEVAALLHDIGKISVADNVLLKPGELTADETLVMDRHWDAGLDILRASCTSNAVLKIVRHASSWFDGSRSFDNCVGEDLPLGSRMLSIADAFDAITSDQLYRRGVSRDQGLAELFRYAGRQFDPQLVEHFSKLNDSQPHGHFSKAARPWLKLLDAGKQLAHWKLRDHHSTSKHQGHSLPFETTMLQEMHDAVIFVDHNLRVVHWNPGAERLTGIAPINVQQRPWVPALLRLQDTQGKSINVGSCPITRAVRSSQRQTGQVTIRGRNNRELSVKLDAMPVRSESGASLGAVVIVQDISSEISLAMLCQRLHEQAINDPMTQTANRAEFQRVHELFVAAHQQRDLPCSLIICDIDEFKQVNDTYGHPAGDEVIKSFARLLKNECYPGDLVARYGGEEFVMLCADCSNAMATQRAEEMRKSFANMPQPALNGVQVTASFGVTEIQPGDTPSTMLSRADRALYQAKQRGRNAVVQLGSGLIRDMRENDESENNESDETRNLIKQNLRSFVPKSMIREKLRGFCLDHRATVVLWEDDHIQLQVGHKLLSLLRRRSDRVAPCILDIELHDVFEQDTKMKYTGINITVSIQKGRDRRNTEAMNRARQLLASLKAYMMVSSESDTLSSTLSDEVETS